MEDSDMNTDVQRTHKLVVGAGVALIAAAGIGVVAVNVHRTVVVKSTASVAPVALPDTTAPQANSQAPQAAPPPPMAEGAPPVADTGTGVAATADTGQTAPNAQPSVTAPKSTRQQSPVASGHQRGKADAGAATPPTAYSATKPAVAEETAMARLPPRDSANNASIAPASSSSTVGGGAVVGSNGGTIDAAPGAVDSHTGAAASEATVPSGAPALSGAEVTTTMQARAAGADSANSDRLITSAVQSQIAADSAGQAANLAVTTINGVVILTGTVPSADVVEHVKQVVQQVKDVKGVDATAVRVSSS
jgi:hyperosmotically inducible periplasmic protein